MSRLARVSLLHQLLAGLPGGKRWSDGDTIAFDCGAGWETAPDQHKVVLKLRNKYSAMRRIVESGSTFEDRIAPKV